MDLSETFSGDKFGVELRRTQQALRMNRDALAKKPGVVNPEASARAYEAGITLLPELWRLEQRK